MKKMTRMLFISDTHGSTPVFTKALGASAAYKAQVLVHGGDILGKYMIPFYKAADGYEAEILGVKELIRTPDEMKAAEAEVDRMGAYPLLTTREEWAELVADADKMNPVFKAACEKRLKIWVEMAEQKLKPLGIKAFLNIGNDDYQSVGSMIEGYSCVVYPNNKVLMLDEDHELLSLGNTNMTPWKCEGDVEEDQLLAMLEALASKLQAPHRAVFNLHCPPVDTKLDVAPQLDSELRPVYLPGGDPRMLHVGCKAVRTLIERVQPLVGLHGHIHESKSIDKIGKTQVFNPGSEYTTGLLNSVLLNLSPDKVESFMFLSA